MIRPLFLVLFCSIFASECLAADDCKAIKDGAARLKCFDQEVQPTSPPKDDAKPEEPIVITMVDAADLKIGSRKYYGKNIGLKRVRCYYADVNDYRCITSELLSVFAKKIEPAAAQGWIEANCDSLKKTVSSPKCLANIYFTFSADDIGDDIVSGYQHRKVITPPDGIKVLFEQDVIRRERRR